MVGRTVAEIATVGARQLEKAMDSKQIVEALRHHVRIAMAMNGQMTQSAEIYQAAADLIDAMRWVPVAERLPDTDRLVDVWLRDSQLRLTNVQYIQNTGEW